MSLGFFNTIQVFEENDEILTEVKSPFGQNHYIMKDSLNIQMLFPDHLKDLSGFAFIIVAMEEVPRVEVYGKIVYTDLNFFLLAVSRKLNARLRMVIDRGNLDYSSVYENRQMDLTVSSFMHVGQYDPKLLTYEETGNCALVPKPDSSSFKLILTRPFNWKIWLAFFASLLSFAVVWRLFKGRLLSRSILIIPQ